MKTHTSVPLAAVVLAALTLAGCSTDPATTNAADATTSSSGSSSSGSSRSGEVAPDDTSLPPWPAPVDDVPARVAAAGLDLGPMGTAEHYHPNLRILIGDTDVQVPANIGVDPTTGAMSALHTHEDDGTLHIEADIVGEVFTLGQLFTEWGVKLTPTQIGGVHAKPGATVYVTSNGSPVSGDPNALRLEPDQRIVMRIR